MKKNYLVIAFSLILFAQPRVFGFQKNHEPDTNTVKKLWNDAFDIRLINAKRSEYLADSAIRLAYSLDYDNGLGHAYRTKGIALGYLNRNPEAYSSFLEAIKYFHLAKNREGEAMVNMNIGNLHREENYDTALRYYEKALKVAKALNNEDMLAKLSLNMGNVYMRQKKYKEALTGFIKGRDLFEKIGDKGNVINCVQNTGVVYYNLKQYEKSQNLLLKALAAAKTNEMKPNIASISLVLAMIYVSKDNPTEAKKYIDEGLLNSQNSKSVHDFNYLNYQLELKQKNYAKAVDILAKVYRADSLANKDSFEQQLDIIDKTNQVKNSAITIAENKNTRSIAIGIGVAAVLLMVVVILLVANVKRKNQTNKQLTDLNAEVSRQKENVDRINRHLEEIIDERTKDLQIKNKKLAEHSSYLSHQIRGPIATLKGLMNLEKEGLVEQEECIMMMNKCVSEIDDKIIDMSDMLHNPGRTGL